MDVPMPHWIHGLWLHEREALLGPRLADVRTLGAPDPQWVGRALRGHKVLIDARLSQRGWTTEVIQALGTSCAMEELCHGLPPPGWWPSVDERTPVSSMRADISIDRTHYTGEDACVGSLFRDLWEPSLHSVLHQLDTLSRTLPVDRRHVAEQLESDLASTIGALVAPTFALELHASRLMHQLSGENSFERRQSFDHALLRGHWRALLQTYPLLARKVHTEMSRWSAGLLRLMTDLLRDWPSLVARCLTDESAPLSSIGPAVGDPHYFGGAVRRVIWASGHSMFYKPRSLSVDRWFQSILARLNRAQAILTMPLLPTVDCGDHGWQQSVTPAFCSSHSDAIAFYRRTGALCAALTALNGTDIHSENLIASGACPYVIDLETLLQPVRRPSRHDTALVHSVLHTGLLPTAWSVGNPHSVQVAALVADATQIVPNAWRHEHEYTDMFRFARGPVAMSSSSAPSSAVTVTLATHLDEFLAGFEGAYMVLSDQLSSWCSDGPPPAPLTPNIRVIMRPTSVYARVLRNCLHPKLLSDAALSEQYIDDLWLELLRRPEAAGVVEAECAAIRGHQVPRFVTTFHSRHVWSTDGRVLDDTLALSSKDALTDSLRRLSPAECARQMRLIEVSLRSFLSEALAPPQQAAAPIAVTKDAAARVSLEDATRCCLDALLDMARPAPFAGRWWVTLVRDGVDTRLGSLPTNFYDGAAGLVTVLAYAGSALNRRDALTAASDALDELLRRLEHQVTSPPPSLGLCGVGGALFGVCHAAVAAGRTDVLPRLLPWAQQITAYRSPLRTSHSADVISGDAGWILSMVSIAQSLGDKSFIEQALDTATGLVALSERLPVARRGAERVLTGFAHGASGYVAALCRLHMATNESRFIRAAERFVAYEGRFFSVRHQNWRDIRGDLPAGRSHYSASWCYGAPGVALSRMMWHEASGDDSALGELRVATATTASHVTLENDSLCHGSCGNADVLLQAAAYLGDLSLREVALRACQVVAAAAVDGSFRCAAPVQGDYSPKIPGFMRGVAGICYALLRCWADVPCLLGFEPTRPINSSH